MKIIQAPNEILSKKCREVVSFDKDLHLLIQKMSRTLTQAHDPDCVGLAANQVGVDLAFFIMRPTTESEITVHINPILKSINPVQKKKSNRKPKIKYEGCMSLPRIWGEMKRAEKVLISFQDQHGKKYEKWYSGFAAQIIQHEIDHLNGILFTQRVLEQGGELFEEKEDKLVPISFQ